LEVSLSLGQGTRRAWGPLLGLIFLTVIEEAFRAVKSMSR
jgi:hypothetical protein